jgi:hypothetical protein
MDRPVKSTSRGTTFLVLMALVWGFMVMRGGRRGVGERRGNL